MLHRIEGLGEEFGFRKGATTRQRPRKTRRERGLFFEKLENRLVLAPVIPLNLDLNSSGNITETGYTGLGTVNSYAANFVDPLAEVPVLQGYGWSSTAPTFDRGVPNFLLEDGHWGTNNEFQVDVANGTYYVTVVMGDASFSRDEMSVTSLDDLTGLSGINTAAGQFQEGSFATTVTDGQLNLQFLDGGGSDAYFVVNSISIRSAQTTYGNAGCTPPVFTGSAPGDIITISATAGTINPAADVDPNYAGVQIMATGGAFALSSVIYTPPALGGTVTITAEQTNGMAKGSMVCMYAPSFPMFFDFNTATSATAPNDPAGTAYIGVGSPNDYATLGTGYGWTANAPTLATGSPVSNDLLSDIHYGTTNTFNVDVANGNYFVNVTLGQSNQARDDVTVNAEGGATELTDLDTSAGGFIHRSFPITVADGQLNIAINGVAGNDNLFAVNGINVLNAQGTGTLTVTQGVPMAGQTTIASGAGSNFTPGALVTVTASLGTIVTADADPTGYAGVQVVASGGGGISFVISNPAGGTANFTAEEVTGKAKWSGTTSFAAAIPSLRRFDFNSSGSPNASGFTSVLPTVLYSGTLGYGYLTTLPTGGFNRTGANPTSKTNDALYQDGHYGGTGTGGARTFRMVAAPATSYDVRVYAGDAAFARDNIKLINAEPGGPGTIISVPNTSANAFTTGTLSAVTDVNGDGYIDVKFQDAGGDPFWVINGLEIALTGTLPAAQALTPTSASANAGATGSALTEAELHPVVQEAVALWTATGLTADQAARLASVNVRVADLADDNALGLAGSGSIVIDNDAAGQGWFIDSSPDGHGEFGHDRGGDLLAMAGSAAAARMDLLTVVMHELGHVIGLSDLDPAYEPDSLMTGFITAGVRRLPGSEASHFAEFGATLGRGEQLQLVDRALSSFASDLSSSLLSDRLTTSVGASTFDDADDRQDNSRIVARLDDNRLTPTRGSTASKRLAIGTGKPRGLSHVEASDEVFANLDGADGAEQIAVEAAEPNGAARQGA